MTDTRHMMARAAWVGLGYSGLTFDRHGQSLGAAYANIFTQVDAALAALDAAGLAIRPKPAAKRSPAQDPVAIHRCGF